MATKEKMNDNRKTAIIVGALFLIAMVTSLVGGILLESVLTAPEYLTSVSTAETSVLISVLLELINGVAVVGIAVMMYPIFNKFDEALALGYVAFRVIESAIIVAAVIAPLTLIALSQEFTAAGESFETVGASLVEVRALLVGQVLGIFFSLAALIFYTLLYRSRLVPRFISVWGLIAVVLIFTWNLLELLGISMSVGMILALPIILNEIFLGFWLIAKGFDSAAAVTEPVQAAIKAA